MEHNSPWRKVIDMKDGTLGKVGTLLRLRGCMGCACGRIFVKAGTDSLIRSDVMLETVLKLLLGFICGPVSLFFTRGIPIQIAQDRDAKMANYLECINGYCSGSPLFI